ncbi:hypothetical protein ILYODFUR_011922 [Ilyodon furcidens]|uniref:Uncharacterized protein n=1 Tax=Ilyodon furcidens TaxID=33524 RepID=A0ABV0U4N1_9TELE
MTSDSLCFFPKHPFIFYCVVPLLVSVVSLHRTTNPNSGYKLQTFLWRGLVAHLWMNSNRHLYVLLLEQENKPTPTSPCSCPLDDCSMTSMSFIPHWSALLSPLLKLSSCNQSVFCRIGLGPSKLSLRLKSVFVCFMASATADLLEHLRYPHIMSCIQLGNSKIF